MAEKSNVINEELASESKAQVWVNNHPSEFKVLTPIGYIKRYRWLPAFLTRWQYFRLEFLNTNASVVELDTPPTRGENVVIMYEIK